MSWTIDQGKYAIEFSDEPPDEKAYFRSLQHAEKALEALRIARSFADAPPGSGSVPGR